MNSEISSKPNHAQELQKLVAKSPLKAKRVLELAARPDGAIDLQVMAGLTREDATALVFHYQSVRG